MCVSPTVIRREIAGKAVYMTVPCGHCNECQKLKQNDTAVLCYREALKKGSMVFATFTYAPGHLPFVRVSADSIKNREKVVPLRRDDITPNEDFDSFDGDITPVETPDSINPVIEFLEGSDLRHIRALYQAEFGDSCLKSLERDGYIYSPSVCRREWRLWLKAARMRYERAHGEKAEFTYICVPEYGNKSGRPHYHTLFFGCSKRVVEELAQSWRDKVGFVDIQEIKQFDPRDISKTPYEAVGKYIGKYMAKGSFEDKKVVSKLVEKPRRMTSVGFGDMESVESLRGYYLCYDLVGEYNPNDRQFFLSLPKKKLDTLCEEIIKRAKYNINGKYYKLPEKIRKRLFYYPVKKLSVEKKTVVVVQSCEIQRFVSAYVRNNIYKDDNAKLQSFISSFHGRSIPVSAFRQFYATNEHHLQDREKFVTKNFQRTYQKSRF